MSHVDHAHDAEGDREADRGKQQDRSEAEPLENAANGAKEDQPILNGRQRFGGGLGSFQTRGASLPNRPQVPTQPREARVEGS